MTLAATPSSSTPQRIGRYEIVRFLGGGMSRVYEARDTVLKRTVALKVLSNEAALDESARARFLREAQLATGVDSDYVVRVYDFGEFEGQLFLVSEFLKGSDLRQALDESRITTLSQRLKILLQVAEGLAAIHEVGIIHRDIKPDNIHLDPNGRVRLMDFGVARSEGLNLTRTGETMGTPYYMAPEQVQAAHVDPRTDIYSFGIVAFEVLTGKRPIAGDTLASLFYKILHEPVDLQPLENANLPPSLVELVKSCTGKRVEERPGSAAIIIQQLQSLMGETPTIPGLYPVQAAKASHFRLLVVAAVLVLLAAGALVWTVSHRNAPQKSSFKAVARSLDQSGSSTTTLDNDTTFTKDSDLPRKKHRPERSGSSTAEYPPSERATHRGTTPFQDHSHPPDAGPYSSQQ